MLLVVSVSGLPLRVRWRLDGIEFNGPPDTVGREWVIDTETGWSASPPVRTDTQPRARQHGAWPTPVYRDARPIRLDGWVYAPTWETRRDAEHRLAALCAQPGRLYELVCTEETGDLTAYVAQDDTTLVSITGGGRYLDFSLQLAAPDPRKYGPEHTAETGLPSDSATGLDFGTDTSGLNFTTGQGPSGDGGLDFGPQAVNGRATATNTGTADTAPVFTLTGPLVPPITIIRTDNGARLVYLDSLAVGEQLVIDVGNRTALRHGATSARHRLIVTNWDDLSVPPRATVDYAFGHGWAANDQARLSVTWRPAWW